MEIEALHLTKNEGEIERLYSIKLRGNRVLTFNKNFWKIREVKGELETLYPTKQMGNRVVTFNKKQVGKEKLHSIKRRGNRDVTFNKTDRK